MTVNGTLAACDWFVVKPEGCEGLTGTGVLMPLSGLMVPCCGTCADASVLTSRRYLVPLKDGAGKSLTG